MPRTRSLLVAFTLPSLVACAAAPASTTPPPAAAAPAEPTAAEAPATKAARQALAALSATDVTPGQAARMAVYEFGEPDYRLPAGLGRALKVLGDPSSDAAARRVLGRALLDEAPAAGVAAQCRAGKQTLVAALDAKPAAIRETLLAQCGLLEDAGARPPGTAGGGEETARTDARAATAEGLLAIVAIGAYLEARGAVAPEERKLLARVARLGAE